jgi:DNA sulfur modification protein DndD
MFFEQVVLKNVGAFRGEHRLDLTASGPARPVILVGALNGSGKTTVIEALQLALYGKRAEFGWRGTKAYQQYLEQLRNRSADPSESTVTEVSLRIADGRKLRVRRSWSFPKGTACEDISVFVNGSDAPDLQLSASWDEEIERILPVRLSELFFFDGEKIEKLADPKKSGEVIKTAIASLMGLSLVDHLIEDLDSLRKKCRKEVLPESERARVAVLESESQRFRMQLVAIDQRAAQLRTLSDRAAERLAQARDHLRSRGGDRFNQREALVATLASTRNEFDGIVRRQRELAAGVLPLQLAQDAIRTLLARAQANTGSESSDTRAAARRELEQMMRWLDLQDRSAQLQRVVRCYLADRLVALQDGADAPTAALDWRTLAVQLDRLAVHRLPGSLAAALESLPKEFEIAETLRRLDDQLRGLPEPEQLEQAISDASAAEAKAHCIARDIASLEEERLLLVGEVRRVLSERDGLLAEGRSSDDAERSAAYCERSLRTLATFRVDLIERRRGQIERLIFDSFQLLIRKPDLVTGIVIDPEELAVHLQGGDGQEISAYQLSAGERQLLAIALLWGLAQASGRPVPVVIDTPLGRLDGDHRRALVEQYFPNAGHQVILLSTDQEVDADYSRMLDDSIAHRYLIEYSPTRQSSCFEPGYFRV